jgi:hypothetical protein
MDLLFVGRRAGHAEVGRGRIHAHVGIERGFEGTAIAALVRDPPDQRHVRPRPTDTGTDGLGAGGFHQPIEYGLGKEGDPLLDCGIAECCRARGR